MSHTDNPHINHPGFDRCTTCGYRSINTHEEPCKSCLPTEGKDSLWEPRHMEDISLDEILGLK